jgi:hypothetical protein
MESGVFCGSMQGLYLEKRNTIKFELSVQKSRERVQTYRPVYESEATLGGGMRGGDARVAKLAVRQSLASKHINKEAEEATSLEAVTRQLMKTQQAENT